MSGYTPLLLAIQQHKYQLIPYFLKFASARETINYQRNGYTALHYIASKEGDLVLQMMALLLKNGASVQSQVEGRTPFWVFCHTRARENESNAEMFKMFVEAGSNINQVVCVFHSVMLK